MPPVIWVVHFIRVNCTIIPIIPGCLSYLASLSLLSFYFALNTVGTITLD